MKRLIALLFIFSTLAFGGIVATAPVKAEDEPLTDEQFQAIQAGCPFAKTSLQRIQRDDLATRLIRGRSYNSLLTLMKTLNVRLSNNNVNAFVLTPIPAQLNSAYETFYNHYKTYDNSVKKTINTDCDNVSSFYDALQTARNDRETLHNDTIKLSELITAYEAEVITIRTGYLPQPAVIPQEESTQ